MKKAADRYDPVNRDVVQGERTSTFYMIQHVSSRRENEMRPAIEWEEFRTVRGMRVLHQAFYCPGCLKLLDVVPDDPQEHCDNCGEELDFTGVEFHEDKAIGLDVAEALMTGRI